jgi:hypothetical protein
MKTTVTSLAGLRRHRPYPGLIGCRSTACTRPIVAAGPSSTSWLTLPCSAQFVDALSPAFGIGEE